MFGVGGWPEVGLLRKHAENGMIGVNEEKTVEGWFRRSFLRDSFFFIAIVSADIKTVKLPSLFGCSRLQYNFTKYLLLSKLKVLVLEL